MSNFWKAIKDFAVEPDPNAIDPTKDLGPQLNTQNPSKPIPVMPAGYNNPFNPIPAAPAGVTNNIFQTPQQISEEEKQVWSNALMSIYNDSRKSNPVYDELITSFESLQNMPGMGDAQKFQAAGTMLHAKYSKQQMIDAANAVLQSIQGANDANDKNNNDRVEKGINAPLQDIQTKQQQILDLQKDITDLTQTINDNKVKIQNRQIGFTMYYNQVIGKVQGDINNINNLIND